MCIFIYILLQKKIENYIDTHIVANHLFQGPAVKLKKQVESNTMAPGLFF